VCIGFGAVIHVGSLAGISNVVPLLIVQFIAANTSSMGMYVGSPTNIILGEPTHVMPSQAAGP
jgi:Na+/H+ antiporter NhaD/arsenite permease-like protein